MKFRLLLTLLFALSLGILPLHAQDTPTPLPSLDIITPENAANIKELARYGDGVLGPALAWSPDGHFLAVTGSLGVWLYDTNDFSAPPQLLEQNEWSQDIAWSPDGSVLASVGSRIYLWDIKTRTNSVLTSGVGAIAFSPDGNLLAVGDTYWDNSGFYWATVKLVDVSTGETRATMESMHSSRITDIKFSPDGSRVAASSSANGDWSGCYIDTIQDLQVWDVGKALQNDGTLITEEQVSLPLYGFNFAFIDDNTIIFSNPAKGVELWSLISDRAERTFPSNDSVERLAYSGKLVAVVSTHELTSELRILDAESGTQQADFKGLYNVSDLAFNPDGTLLTVIAARALHLWDVHDSSKIVELTVPSFKTIGEILESTSMGEYFHTPEPQIDKWQIAEGHRLEGVYSPDRTRLAYKDMTYGWAAVYMSSSARHIDKQLVYPGQLNDVIGTMLFSPNGTRFAFVVDSWSGCGPGASYSMYIWDTSSEIASAKQLASISLIQEANDLTFNADGRLLAGAAGTGIFIWDANTGDQLVSYPYGHRGNIQQIAFSDDGKLLISTGFDGTVRLWGVPHSP